MIKAIALFFFIPSTAFGQLTLSEAKNRASEYNYTSYRYHEQFEGHQGYAAPILILTNDELIFFGVSEDGTVVNVIKLVKEGILEWKSAIKVKYDEMETQSIIQDNDGNFYAFLLSYDYDRYRGGSERVIHLDKNGSILWDIILGDYTLLNRPLCSYIRLLEDGRLALRGHIVVESAEEGKDPEYHFWEGWLNNNGDLTQEIGKVINWGDPVWKKFIEVEQ